MFNPTLIRLFIYFIMSKTKVAMSAIFEGGNINNKKNKKIILQFFKKRSTHRNCIRKF